MPVKDLLAYAAIGAIIAIHWLTFFGSVKYANASVAVATYATVSFILSFAEPFMLRSKFSWLDLWMGLLIVPAILLIINGLDTGMHTGFYLGMISALLSALFGVLNKKMVSKADPMVISGIEMLAATGLLIVLLPVWLNYEPLDQLIPQGTDWIYMSILVLGCTTLAFYISIRTLRYISAFSQSMVMNLEPVYGIVFGAILLGDNKELNPQFYIGVCIILLTVFLHPFLKRRFSEVSN